MCQKGLIPFMFVECMEEQSALCIPSSSAHLTSDYTCMSDASLEECWYIYGDKLSLCTDKSPEMVVAFLLMNHIS